MLPELMRSI